MKTTTRFGFKKPDGSDYANINVLNENMDALDTILDRNDKSINALDSGMSTANSKLNDHGTDIDTLKSGMATAHSTLSNHGTDIDTLKREMAIANSDIRTLVDRTSVVNFIYTFDSTSWTVSNGKCTITLPVSAHKITGSLISWQVVAYSAGVYRGGMWKTIETYVTFNSTTKEIVVHYPGTAGYSGRIMLSGQTD